MAKELNSVITVDYLEGVAGVRFAMMETATLMYSMLCDQGTVFSYPQQQLAFQLMQIVKEVCTDPAINATDFTEVDVIGPAVYLIKLIVRQYGFSCLQAVTKEYQWIVPTDLHGTDKVSYDACFIPYYDACLQEKNIDPFVIYSGYSEFRKALSETLYVKQIENLDMNLDITQVISCRVHNMWYTAFIFLFKDSSTKVSVVFLLAMYQTITVAYSTSETPMGYDVSKIELLLSSTSLYQ